MHLEPTEYDWRTIPATVGDDVRVPRTRHTTTILPDEDDPERVTVSYLSREPDVDVDAEPESPTGGTLEAVNAMTVAIDDPVPLNHFHDDVTLYPSPDGDSLSVYFLGPIPFASGERYARSGEIETYREERDPSR